MNDEEIRGLIKNMLIQSNYGLYKTIYGNDEENIYRTRRKFSTKRANKIFKKKMKEKEL